MAGDPPGWKQIGRILLEMGLVTERHLLEVLAVQQKEGGLIGPIFVRLGYITVDDLILALVAQLGRFEVSPEFLANARVATRRKEVTFDHVPTIDHDPMAHSSPVVKLVQLILSTALGAGATEVRFDLRSDRFEVRYRVDGVLYDMEWPPRHLAPPLFRRLRHLTGLAGDARELTAGFDGRRYRVTAASVRSSEEESIVLGFLLI